MALLPPQTSTVPGYTISSLPPVVAPATELPGALHEVEVPVGNGDYENRQITSEQLATYFGGTPGGTPDLSEALSLTAAQARPNAQPPNPKVLPGLRYLISGNWNNGTLSDTVHVDGLTPTSYAPTGWVLDDNDVYQLVRVNVAAGTVDTRPLRDLQLLIVEVDETTGDFTAWVGGDIAPGYVIEEHLIP